MANPAMKSVATFDASAVAVGEFGSVFLSTDRGVTWAEKSPVSGNPNLVGVASRALATAASRQTVVFVAVSSGALDTFWYSSLEVGDPPGASDLTSLAGTWVESTFPSSAARQGIVRMASAWVVLTGASITWRADDGTASVVGSWVDATGPGGGTLRGAVEHGGYLYVCGDSGLIERTDSAPGSASPTWETLTSGTANDLLAIYANDDVIVACGASGTIVYSTDGTAWAAATNADSDALRSIIYDGGNRWVANGDTLESMESYRGLFNHGTTTLTTKWIKPGGSSWGQARVWAAKLVAKRLGPHGIDVDVGYDYSDTWTDTFSWTSDEIDGIVSNDEPYQLDIRPTRQLVSAIRFRIREISPAEHTYGAVFISLVLDVGIRQGGAAKLPRANRR